VSRSAQFPWRDGRPTHLPCGPGDVPRCVLLPGDPDRVGLAAALLDDVVDLGQAREFRIMRGRWQGLAVGVCSTGIGGPSTEIALVELANLGVTHAIRIGGMGAIAPDLALGSFVIVERALRGSGAAQVYVPDAAPLAASPAVCDALAGAAAALGLPHRRAMVATSDSYYLGQGRPVRPGGTAPDVLARLAAAGAVGVDMESETVLAVASVMGVAAGAVLAVHANRATDQWLEDYAETQRNVVRIALGALASLASQTTSM
jgi:uridine phosphorylase